jgi:type III secretion system YscD/HrpQ family protein
MSGRLIAEEGILKGLELPFNEGQEWVIGRDPEACQLLLEDPAASRKHLLCRSTPLGITLENLSTTNPVQVNDQELIGSHLLQAGDAIRIGSGLYRYFISSSHETETAEPEKLAGEPSEPQPDLEEHYDSILEEDQDAIAKHKLTEINFDISEAGRWLLKVISGPNNGAEFSMQEGQSYLIGTDPNLCDIVFHDTSVSRKHAKISVEDDGVLYIEDQGSRNGIFVDGEAQKERVELPLNTIVNLGTSSFVVYDREGNMQTIISPLLPSIVKVLQRTPETESEEKKESPELNAPVAPIQEPPKEKSMGTLIAIGILTGLFVLTAIGTTTLFNSEPVVKTQVADTDKLLGDAFANYPSIKYSFNKGTGRLVLFGHLLTAQDKTQLIYNLQGLPFIKSFDDSGVIIDEYVWRETNQVLNKNPNWRTITLQSPTAGQFVLMGNLQSRKEAEQLYEYITTNFPYLDRLEKNIIIEEEIADTVKSGLEKIQLVNAKSSFKNGEITISGGIPPAKESALNQLVEEFKKIPGVRSVKVQTNSLAPDQAMQDISDRYEVTGFSRIGSTISVIVNGRIITKGDVLDGMAITNITPGTIFLEKNDVKYRINFSK